MTESSTPPRPIRAELVLLDSQSACAAVTWPRVDRFDESAEDFEQRRVGAMEIPGSGLWFSIEDWSGKSGVMGPDLVRIFKKLFGNELIGANGEVEGDVVRYAKALIARRLKSPVHRTPTASGGRGLDS